MFRSARHRAMSNNPKAQNLAAFLERYPALHDELFRFSDAGVRALALTHLARLKARVLAQLCDRAKYISVQRILPRTSAPHRCRDKVIYDEVGARTKVNEIWAAGRGASII